MAGRETPDLAAAAVAGGADLVELGFPFSDPLADGPAIRLAAERALAEGMRTAACLDCLRRTRELVDVPLVPMTYAALLEAYGWERFAADARGRGRDVAHRRRPSRRPAAGAARVQLVAPTSSDERIALAAARTDGWLYLVTLTGTTGVRTELSPELAPLVERTRAADGGPALRGVRHLDARARCRRCASSPTESSWGRRRSLAAEDGPRALERFVASLRAALT